MEKISKIAKQIGNFILIVGFITIWFLALSYSIQHTIFNR